MSGLSESNKSNPTVAVEVIYLSAQDRAEIEARARANARSFGISDPEWDDWRRGHGLGRDLLMMLDPEREADRIIEARSGADNGKE